METGIASGVDAIVSVPIVPETFLPVYEKALEAGILIAESAVGSSGMTENVVNESWTDNVKHGMLSADKINEVSGGKANVLVVYTGPDTLNQETALNSFKAHTEENYPDIKIIDVVIDKSDVDIAIQGIINSLTAYPEIDWIWGIEGWVGTAAGVALTELGREPLEVKTIAMDMTVDTVDYIKQGIVYGGFDQNFNGWGASPVEQLHNYWTGKPVEKVVDTGLIWFDADNIDTYVPFE